MPLYRSRRRKYSRRRLYKGKSRNLLRKIKKDILKNNFPTKVKMMGLPEKKTMFLQHVTTISPNGNGTTLWLEPTNSRNIETIVTAKQLINNDRNSGVRISNWDKISILAIYVRIQPVQNMFAGVNAGGNIVPVSCYYALNNNTPDNNNLMNTYNSELINLKNVFTFNSNEAFTFVIKAPSTMISSSPTIYKKYQWWSIADINILGDQGENRQEGSDLYNDDNDDDINGYNNTLGTLNTPYVNGGIAPNLHCGYLFFKSATDCSFNVTVSYKVALRG